MLAKILNAHPDATNVVKITKMLGLVIIYQIDKKGRIDWKTFYDQIVSFFRDNELRTGIVLNLNKSFVRTIDDIRVNGMDIPGSHVGSVESRRAFLSCKVDAIKEKIRLLRHLPR